MVIVLYMSRCLCLTFYSSGWLIRSPTSLAAAVPSQGWQTPNVFLCFPLPLRQALNMQDLYPHLAMCRHMSTSILNYVYIYIYMCMCVFMCCHIHYPSNLIVPIKICLISATDDFVFIYFGARIPGFGLSHLFVPPGALACVSSGRTLRTAHVPIVHIIPCK